jgi:hypothetical protein
MFLPRHFRLIIRSDMALFVLMNGRDLEAALIELADLYAKRTDTRRAYTAVAAALISAAGKPGCFTHQRTLELRTMAGNLRETGGLPRYTSSRLTIEDMIRFAPADVRPSLHTTFAADIAA